MYPATRREMEAGSEAVNSAVRSRYRLPGVDPGGAAALPLCCRDQRRFGWRRICRPLLGMVLQIGRNAQGPPPIASGEPLLSGRGPGAGPFSGHGSGSKIGSDAVGRRAGIQGSTRRPALPPPAGTRKLRRQRLPLQSERAGSDRCGTERHPGPVPRSSGSCWCAPRRPAAPSFPG